MKIQICSSHGKTFTFHDVSRLEMRKTDHGIDYDVHCQDNGQQGIEMSSEYVVIRVDNRDIVRKGEGSHGRGKTTDGISGDQV